MSIKASPEIIRNMESNLKKNIREIELISSGIEKARNSQSGWNDEQSQRYMDIMHQIALLTASPIEQINSVIPKLEKLAQALDGYNNVRF